MGVQHACDNLLELKQFSVISSTRHFQQGKYIFMMTITRILYMLHNVNIN